MCVHTILHACTRSAGGPAHRRIRRGLAGRDEQNNHPSVVAGDFGHEFHRERFVGGFLHVETVPSDEPAGQRSSCG